MDRNRIATVNIVFSVNALFFAKTFGEPEKCIIFAPVFTGTTLWSDARVVEEARLESVYTPKAYRGFESPSFRNVFLILKDMNNLIATIATITLLLFTQCHYAQAQEAGGAAPVATGQAATAAATGGAAASLPADSTDDALLADSAGIDLAEVPDSTLAPVESVGFHKMLKTKYIEGSAGFMSFVALALVLGLAFCIERIIYLTLSEINAKKLMADLESQIMQGDIEGAKTTCRDTRGPVASICYQGLSRIDESMEDIERSIYDSCGRYESGPHNDHLRTHSRPYIAGVLQLHPFQDRAYHQSDGRIGDNPVGHNNEI